MENVDMFNAATAPLTFHDFLDRMRHPQAADLVRSIKSFIVEFLSNAPDPESDSESVQRFLSTTESAFHTHPLFLNATEEELESAGEGLEKYLMTKLFARAFASLPEDAEHDQRLSEKMGMLQEFIRPEHLDIPPNFQNESSWLLAQKELQKINTYKAPRDKLVCILNCCRVINNLLLNVSIATKENPPGADDFLPVLIYVVIKANPPQLHSNLLYISRYRHHSRLVSEAAYFYTNLVSAESFIDNLEAKSLSMDHSEFEKRMQAATAALERTKAYSPPSIPTERLRTNVDNNPSTEVVSKVAETSGGVETGPGLTVQREDQIDSRVLPAATAVAAATTIPSSPKESILEKGAPSVAKLEAAAFPEILDADRTGQLERDYPYLYASAGDLRVRDVEVLLTDYKELVLKYVALCKAVEGSGLPGRSQASLPLLDLKDAGASGVGSRAAAILESAIRSTDHSLSIVLGKEREQPTGTEESLEEKRTNVLDNDQDLFDRMQIHDSLDEGGVKPSSEFADTTTDYSFELDSSQSMEGQPERDHGEESAADRKEVDVSVVPEDTTQGTHILRDQ